MSNGSGGDKKGKTLIGGSFEDMFGAMGRGPAPTAAPTPQPPGGQPDFGQPNFGQPNFGQPNFGQPNVGQQPQSPGGFGGNPFGQPGGGMPGGGMPGGGMPQNAPFAGNPFGQPAAQPGSSAGLDWGGPAQPGISAGFPAGGMRGIGQPPGTMGASPFGGASMATPQPAQTPAQPHKIDLSVALAAKDFPPGALKNPLVAQAAKLLILFGRLRMQVVAMEAQPLLMHVFQEIKNYGEALRRAGMDPQEVSWGQYFLAATADDIVQNLPGPDRHLWLNASMTAQFFQDRTSGTRFFQEVERLLTIPAQGFRLLELALLCLSLGFEGRYRSEPNGSVALQRFREAIYESLRRIEARPDEDISPRWQPMLMGGKQKIGGAWVLALVGLLAAGLVGGYITLRTLLSTQSGEAVAKLALMVTHPVDDKVEAQKITLVRPVVVDDQPASGTDIQAEPDPGPIVADTAPPKTLQADRINQALAEEIAAGKVTVTQKGSYIDIALTADSLPFASGRADIAADLGTDLEVLAAKLGTLIDAEQGPVKIVGYTDTVGLRATNKFKNNQLLSTARATSVLTMLSAHVADPGRLTAEGRGEADALGDNKTKEGQRQNRRVEIWLLREEML